MVINRVRVLRSRPYTPTQFFLEYPPPAHIPVRQWVMQYKQNYPPKNLTGELKNLVD